MNFVRAVLETLRTKVGQTLGVSAGLTGGYVLYKDYHRYPAMMEAYSKGALLPPFSNNKFEVTFTPRPAIEKQLRKALSPTFTNEYYLVIGEVGSGKSRLLQELVREMMSESAGGQGAPIYVLSSQGRSIADTLADAVNFKFDEHLSFDFFVNYALRVSNMPQKDDHNKFMRVLDAIEESAYEYSQKNGRPIVLIIDGVENMGAQKPRAMLNRLQEKAKLWADTNIAKVILVSNDEETEVALQSNKSAWSRADRPIYIGDMSLQEAVDFLTAPHVLRDGIGEPIDEQTAQKIFSFVGGRVLHLALFKMELNSGSQFEEVLIQLKEKEKEKFMNVVQNKEAMKALTLIRKASGKSVSFSTLVQGSSHEVVKFLAKNDIIRMTRKQDGGIMVNFQSVLTEHVVEELMK